MEQRFNSKNQLIVEGCNYHTTWQSNKAMRFVLSKDEGDRVILKTRTTGKVFFCKTEDLIFITSGYNIRKACNILNVKWIDFPNLKENECDATEVDIY